MPLEDEEEKRIGSHVLVLGQADGQAGVTLRVVAFADDREVRVGAGEDVDTLFDALVLCPVSGLVLRERCVSSPDRPTLSRFAAG
jgi:hypothetical protein